MLIFYTINIRNYLCIFIKHITSSSSSSERNCNRTLTLHILDWLLSFFTEKWMGAHAQCERDVGKINLLINLFASGIWIVSTVRIQFVIYGCIRDVYNICHLYGEPFLVIWSLRWRGGEGSFCGVLTRMIHIELHMYKVVV